jgi:hypothetical protein
VRLTLGRVGSLEEGEAMAAACTWGREIRGCVRKEAAEEKPALAPGCEGEAASNRGNVLFLSEERRGWRRPGREEGGGRGEDLAPGNR